jgi:acetyl esterase/lipase
MQRLRFAFLMLATLLAACANPQFLNTVTPKSGYVKVSNLPFDDADGLRLDVYSPNQAHDAPVVIFFYGGRWEQTYTRPKEAFEFVGEALSAQGFVTVIPDYRTYPGIVYPAFLKDCAKATAWVHQNIASYGGSNGKIVLLGHSSGAYNAAMLALDDEFLQQAGGTRAWLQGMIGIAGPYDFLPITDPTLRTIFGAPENYDKTQPVFWTDGRNPPMLLIHGANDETVPVANTRELAQRVQRAGGPIETLIYPDLEHEWSLTVLAKINRSRADVLDNIAAFVRKVTNTAAPAAPGAKP